MIYSTGFWGGKKRGRTPHLWQVLSTTQTPAWITFSRNNFMVMKRSRTIKHQQAGSREWVCSSQEEKRRKLQPLNLLGTETLSLSVIPAGSGVYCPPGGRGFLHRPEARADRLTDRLSTFRRYGMEIRYQESESLATQKCWDVNLIYITRWFEVGWVLGVCLVSGTLYLCVCPNIVSTCLGLQCLINTHRVWASERHD